MRAPWSSTGSWTWRVTRSSLRGNREQVDEWRPTGEDVQGTLWLHVPRGGMVLMTALQPSVLAALAGGGATMWFLLRNPKTRREENQDDET